jgi:hypothetical protein
MPSVSKPPSVGSLGGGNPPKCLRARVVNILPSGVIMVGLLERPLEKNLRSAGPLIGPKPLTIKVGDTVHVIRNRSGSFEFLRIEEKAAAPDLATAIRSAVEAVPSELEIEQTERHQIVKPAISPAPPPPQTTPEPAAAKISSSGVLENTFEILSDGKHLNKRMLQRPTAELIVELERWLEQAKEVVTCYISETKLNWTSNLVRIRGDIAKIAKLIPRLSEHIKQAPQTFVVPVPENIALEITDKVPEPPVSPAELPAPKSVAPNPLEAPGKPVQASRLTPEEEELRRIFEKHGLNTPIVRLFIEVQTLLISNFAAHRTLEQIRSLHETVKMLLAEGRFDAECNAGEFESHIEINRELYRQTFKEFAIKFERYLNAKDIDPMRLIDNYFRTGNKELVFKACSKYEISFLEKRRLDSEDQKRASDLVVWLKFLFIGDNLTLEYPSLKYQPATAAEPEKGYLEKLSLRRMLAALEEYLKSGQR